MDETGSARGSLKAYLLQKGVWLQFVYATGLLVLALSAALASSAARRLGDANLSVILAVLALILAVLISVTVVPRLARAVDLGALFMPITFSITRAGGMFIAIIFIVALAALNTGNNLLFLILAVFLAAIVASGVLSRATLKGLAVTLQVPDIVFAETAVLLRVTLRNYKRVMPSFSLSVEGFRFGDAHRWRRRLRRLLHAEGKKSHPGPSDESLILPDTVYFPNIPAQKSIAVSVVSRFPRRGRYSLDGFSVATRFPFGFFKKGRRFQASGDLVVYPRPSEVGAYFHLLPFAEGHRENLFKGTGENLYSHRPYVQGDSVRRLDWKASAKLGDLMLKEYAKEDDRKVFIYLDTRISTGYVEQTAERFERAVAMAAGLSTHFIQDGAEVEFAVPESVVPLHSGEQHLHRILGVLAVIEPVWGGVEQEFHWPSAGAYTDSASRAVPPEKQYKILLTSRAQGSIPSAIWRTSRVEYFNQL